MRKILYFIIIVITSLSARAQDFSKWANGCYYDTTGKKTCGFIRWDIPSVSLLKGDGDHIFFKDSLNSPRQKIHTNQLRAFVMHGDSLVISRSDDLSYFPILLVVINNPLKLYIRLSADMSTFTPRMNNSPGVYISGGVEKTYYFGPDPDIVLELTKSKFIEVMSSIIADDTELVGAIKK